VKSMRIRKWMVVGILTILMFPWWVYVLAHFLNMGIAGTWPSEVTKTQEQSLITVTNMIMKDRENWNSKPWQATLRTKLAELHMRAVIANPSGTEVFSDNHAAGHWNHPARQLDVIDDGQFVGTISLYTETPFDKVATIFAILAIGVAIFIVSFQMQRNVIKPLEGMGKAARKIANGDLDFELPATRVSEIAEVRKAFLAMGAGLRKSIAKQAKLEAERRFFISAIAHDLRTPLFALRGYLEGLDQGIANTPDKVNKYIAICREKSDQLERLVSDLFEFAKLEYMEQSLQVEPFDFGQVMERSVDSLRPKAEAKNVNITLDFPINSCRIPGDAHLLERAISNLLDNAIRHTPTSGEVTISWALNESRVAFRVADTGPGFNPEDLPQIFDPLFRGETSRNRETGGTGLGLTIAKRIIKAHGGDLIAANQITGGAILTGWIPASRKVLEPPNPSYFKKHNQLN
jgi:signal transduction histidine kinase